jgi:transcriptional regulator with XRE-family HTH domain
MTSEKQQRLEAAGWKVSSAAEFLGLTPEEEAIVETSRILSRMVRQKREEKGWNQTQLADHLGCKQPQVTRLETGTKITFDAQFAALFAMGVQPREIATALMEVTLNNEAPPPNEVTPSQGEISVEENEDAQFAQAKDAVSL